jgi:hypothetical protein
MSTGRRHADLPKEYHAIRPSTATLLETDFVKVDGVLNAASFHGHVSDFLFRGRFHRGAPPSFLGPRYSRPKCDPTAVFLLRPGPL